MTEQQKLNRETELKIAQMGVNDAILQQMMASSQPGRDGFDVGSTLKTARPALICICK